jgi:hypothetical protein
MMGSGSSLPVRTTANDKTLTMVADYVVVFGFVEDY